MKLETNISIIQLRKILIVLLFLVFLLGAQAQSDSLIVVEETIENNDAYYQHKYQYLDILLSDNVKALKFAIQPFKPERYINFGVLVLQMAYEQKMSASFSLVNEINTTTFWGGTEKINELGYAIGLRWYPMKKSEIEKGISGNTVNGPYLGLKADNIFNAKTFRGINSNESLKRYFNLNPTPEFTLGYQHKFSRLLYIDSNVFANYSINNKELGYGLTLLIGTSFNIEN
ncbi:MAG: hypothetical protein ACERKD_09510 [Prolixibacteraceae bacterium]